MNENTRSLLFLTVMALVVGNGLASISIGLKDRIDNNMKMMRVGSLLSVLEVPDCDNKTDEELLSLYQQKIVELKSDPVVYVYRENGQDIAYAFDVGGRGLWDKIRGFLAVENDEVTVRAVRFYEQSETPGLGGEIGTNAFTSRFRGKKLRQANTILHITKAGSVPELSAVEVDGISGATLTCDAVNVFLIASIEKFLERKEQK